MNEHIILVNYYIWRQRCHLGHKLRNQFTWKLYGLPRNTFFEKQLSFWGGSFSSEALVAKGLRENVIILEDNITENLQEKKCFIDSIFCTYWYLFTRLPAGKLQINVIRNYY